MEKETEALIADYEARIEALDSAIGDSLDGQTISVVRARPDEQLGLRLVYAMNAHWHGFGLLSAHAVIDDMFDLLADSEPTVPNPFKTPTSTQATDEADAPSAQETTPLPRTVTDFNGEDVVIEDDSAIIALDGPVTEIVYALGAADRLVATDSSSTYPEEATELPQVGYVRRLSAEPILGMAP